MGNFNFKTGKRLGAYALALGLASLAAGLVEILGGYGEMIPSDWFGGYALVVIAATYLNGINDVSKGKYDGLSFLMGGLFLTAIFGVLYLLIIGADGLMYILGEADELPAFVDLRPAIWIFIFSLPLACAVHKLTRRMAW
ncbi:MAG: hypothetical protein JW986_08325 [Methanotrichaceae archaeon]|nr:hypothetical protein [Methanotrichaceae archaeon]